MSRLSALLVAAVVSCSGLATDPPGLAVASSDPQVTQPAGSVTVPSGRFVPLNVASGKPALVLGNDAGLVEIFTIEKGHSLIGIRFDEPALAKAKRYTFPQGVTHV